MHALYGNIFYCVLQVVEMLQGTTWKFWELRNNADNMKELYEYNK